MLRPGGEFSPEAILEKQIFWVSKWRSITVLKVEKEIHAPIRIL
jgi:hypothetical protein